MWRGNSAPPHVLRTPSSFWMDGASEAAESRNSVGAVTATEEPAMSGRASGATALMRLVGCEARLVRRPHSWCEPAKWRAFLTPFIMRHAARI